MKFRLTIYAAFEAKDSLEAADIADTVKSSIQLQGLTVDEYILEKDVRISLEEAINNLKNEA